MLTRVPVLTCVFEISEESWHVLGSVVEYSVPSRAKARVGPFSVFAHSSLDSASDGLSRSAVTTADYTAEYTAYHTDAGHDVVTVHQCNSEDCASRNHLATLAGDLTRSLGGIPAPDGHACEPGQLAYDFCVSYLPAIPSGTGYWRLVRHLPYTATAWHPSSDHLAGTTFYGDPTNDDEAWSIPFGGFDEFLFASGDKSAWLITTRDAAIGEFYTNAPRDILQSSISGVPYQAAWVHRDSQSEDPYISLTDHDAIVHGSLLYVGMPATCCVESTPNLHAPGGFNVFVRTVGTEAAASAEYRSPSGVLEIVLTSDVPLRLAGTRGCAVGGVGMDWLGVQVAAGDSSTYKTNPADCVTVIRGFPECNQNFFKWASVAYGHDGNCACLKNNFNAVVHSCTDEGTDGEIVYEILWNDVSQTDDKYGLTFLATGCCNDAIASSTPNSPGDIVIGFWKAVSDALVFQDMYYYCTRVRDGTALDFDTETCGCGGGVPVCTLQTQL